MIDVTKTGRLTDWAEAEGKTIASVIDYPLGRYADDIAAVILFVDGTWMAIGCETNDPDWDVSPTARGVRHDDTICDYLKADQMLRVGWISQALHDEIAAREKEIERQDNERKAKRLRDELIKLEGAPT
jgi:hypothetical protein